MEQRFYKVKLTTGRVLGPLDLDRIALFIHKGIISGLEQARQYPDGEWKDVNSFEDIAKLLLLKLEGKLVVKKEEELASEPTETPVLIKTQTTPQKKEQSKKENAAEEEKTFILSVDTEKTVISSNLKKDENKIQPEENKTALTSLRIDQLTEQQSDNEKTKAIDFASLAKDSKPKSKFNFNKKRLYFIGAGAAVAAVLVFAPVEKESKESFKVTMPVPATLGPDPQKAEKLFIDSISAYNEDTVPAYQLAAKKLLKSLEYDIQNPRAMALLASSYMNLIDVVKKNENYFTVITRLVEQARTSGKDLEETVIADIEMFLVLGNPDAALNRIVDFSKDHTYSPVMYYYLALTYYQKGQYVDAMKALQQIDQKQYFSARIFYLYGLVFEKNEQSDDAIKAYHAALAKSPEHAKSISRLAEVYFKKDNLPEALKYADLAIEKRNFLSKKDLAKIYFMRARAYITGGQNEQALADLIESLKLESKNPDYLLEYYTVQSRLGKADESAAKKAKDVSLLAEGEKALQHPDFHTATSAFLSARDVSYNEVTPVIKLAEVFIKKGDFVSARTNLEKALKLNPKNKDIYEKHITTLIQLYEFEDAIRQLQAFKSLQPNIALFDEMYGDLFYRQKQYLKAAAYYKKALSESDANTDLYLSYANCLFETGSFADSAFYYGLARRFDPLSVEASVGVAKSLSEIQNLDKGVQFLTGTLERSNNRAGLLNGIAQVYFRKGDYNNALKFSDNAIHLNSKLANAYKTKADSYFYLEQYKEALDNYQLLKKLEPTDPESYLGKYRIFMTKTDLKSAKEEINQLISVYPRYPGAYYFLGEIYYKGQNYASVLENSLKEIDNNPGFLAAYVQAATIYNLGKKYSDGLAVSNKALSMDNNYVPALIQAGYSNHMLKAYAGAQAMLERAVSMDSGNPQIHRRLGALYVDLGDLNKAKEHIQIYLNLLPDAPDREQLEQYLK